MHYDGGMIGQWNTFAKRYYTGRNTRGTRTGNGSLNIDRPITVTGRIGREIDTDLGKGGPTLRLRTKLPRR